MHQIPTPIKADVSGQYSYHDKGYVDLAMLLLSGFCEASSDQGIVSIALVELTITSVDVVSIVPATACVS